MARVKHLQYRREFMEWQKRHDATAPRVGDQGPDFELAAAAGEETLRLSDLKGGLPVALVFGSFT